MGQVWDTNGNGGGGGVLKNEENRLDQFIGSENKHLSPVVRFCFALPTRKKDKSRKVRLWVRIE